MRALAKRDGAGIQKKLKCLDIIQNFITIPLNFMRDYTVPMGDINDWNRNRAAIVPITMPIAFFILMGFVTR